MAEGQVAYLGKAKQARNFFDRYCTVYVEQTNLTIFDKQITKQFLAVLPSMHTAQN